jgi:hypothetical protein
MAECTAREDVKKPELARGERVRARVEDVRGPGRA